MDFEEYVRYVAKLKKKDDSNIRKFFFNPQKFKFKVK